MAIDIGIIQFPGSNTERETILACHRAKMNPVEFLWNQSGNTLPDLSGYIIVGGFSYEDRSRSGIIAALDPIMKQVEIEASKGKPVLGICNGAQILVESGLVPGLKKNKLGIALTDNKRVKRKSVLGVGYYNTWSKLKMTSYPDRCAFTRHLKSNEQINVPLAHSEGRFVIPNELLEKMISNNQTIFRYCDKDGKTIDEFPINPNGSIHNLAAVCNPGGNIMAMMPHPERTKNGDPIFSSMKEFIERKNPITDHSLIFENPQYSLGYYKSDAGCTEWTIEKIITDNEAKSVQIALSQIGLDITITRQTHWEISTVGNTNEILKKIDATGELYNSNKEFISESFINEKTASFLVRQREDIQGRIKYESLKKRFGIGEITNIKYGVIWNVIVNSGIFETVLNQVLDTNILFNPLSHECYRIN